MLHVLSVYATLLSHLEIENGKSNLWEGMMKKYRCSGYLLVLLIVIALFTSCPSNNGGEESYYIKAKLDGTVYEWVYGKTDVEPAAFGTFHSSDVIGTEIYAQPIETSSEDPAPDNYVLFYVLSPLNSPASYTLSDFKYKTYWLNGASWTFTSLVFEVTSYDSVGGTIKGTFSGTIDEFLGTGTMAVTDGQFVVKRIADDTRY
jgi:hypothetical protein